MIDTCTSDTGCNAHEHTPITTAILLVLFDRFFDTERRECVYTVRHVNEAIPMIVVKKANLTIVNDVEETTNPGECRDVVDFHVAE